MRYAIVNGEKSEPQPKQRGRCSYCDSEMIAKCGRHMVWHWAHKSRDMCDPWWENETLWHREWKDNFPMEWQEVTHTDDNTGERHIADVKNPFGLVIEFQYSPMSAVERESREDFYENMIWVVNGTKGLNKDYFNMGLCGPIQDNPLAYSVEWWSKSRLLHNWSESKVKVYIDFEGNELWRLVLYDPETKRGVVGPISKKAFIEDCTKGKDISVASLPEGSDSTEFQIPRFVEVGQD